MNFSKRFGYNAKFFLLQACFWASNCIYYSFLVAYLTEKGYSEFISGIAMTLVSIVSAVSQPIIGYITDTFLTGKKLLTINFCIALPLTFLLPLFVGSVPLALASILILSVFDYTAYSIIDSWSIKLKDTTQPQLDYGFTRSGGSIGYSVTALIFGKLISTLGYNLMFFAHAAYLLCMILIITRLEAVPCCNVSAQSSDEGRLSIAGALSLLLKNRFYIVLIASAAFYQFAMRTASTYITVIVKYYGGNSTHLGIAIFMCSFFEIFSMFYAGKLIKCGIKMEYIFAVGLIFGFARMILYCYGNLWSVIFTQLLTSVASGIYIRVFIEYISLVTPKRINATATTFGVAVSFGLGGVGGNFLGGLLIQSYGLMTYLYVSIFVMLGALIVFLPNIIKPYKNA
ncbi:MAG TPA: hypothetical protein DCP97_05670 [Ruminococcaceae bacterium]|nr:hypothetical protein [Oscillospiraceae bacterium]